MGKYNHVLYLHLLRILYRYPNWKPPTGKRQIEYEQDATKRRQKKKQRKQSLFKAGHELTTICGGSAFVLYKDSNNVTSVYTNNEEMWKDFCSEGLTIPGKFVRLGQVGEELVTVQRRDLSLSPQVAIIPQQVEKPTPTKSASTPLSFTSIPETQAIDIQILHSHPESSSTTVTDLPVTIQLPHTITLADVEQADDHAMPSTSSLTTPSSPGFSEPATPRSADPPVRSAKAKGRKKFSAIQSILKRMKAKKTVVSEPASEPGMRTKRRRTTSVTNRKSSPQTHHLKDICFVCNSKYETEDPKGPWVGCTNENMCHSWAHYRCVGWGSFIGKNVTNKEYLCPECT